jgi:hypothetical protein
MRAGDFSDYFLQTQPWSMARQDPNTRLQRIMQFIATNIPALAQAFQLLGPAFNIEGAMNLILRELGVDEADELINSRMLMQRVQMMMQMVQPDGQLAMQMGQPSPAMPGGGRPQQPNPGQMGPTDGWMPQQEQNSNAQQGAPQPAAIGGGF